MKKRTLLAGAILVGGTAYAYKKFDDSVNNIPEDMKRQKSTYEFTEEHETITVNEYLESIIVSSSKDNKTHVTCYENEQYYYDFEEKDNHFKISPRIASDYLEKAKDVIRRDRHVLKVEISKSFSGKLVVKSKNGNINIENLEVSELYTNVDNGSLVVKGITVKNACGINNTNGTINADNIEAGTFNCVNSNGTTIVYNINTKENASIDSKNGGISGFGVVAGDKLSISNRNGKIELESLDFGKEGEISNRNGNINVTLAGEEQDYNIIALSNDYGTVDTPEGCESGKPITLENRHGRIKLSFEW